MRSVSKTRGLFEPHFLDRMSLDLLRASIGVTLLALQAGAMALIHTDSMVMTLQAAIPVGLMMMWEILSPVVPSDTMVPMPSAVRPNTAAVPASPAMIPRGMPMAHSTVASR